jgi:hypothetical protein
LAYPYGEAHLETAILQEDLNTISIKGERQGEQKISSYLNSRSRQNKSPQMQALTLLKI